MHFAALMMKGLPLRRNVLFPTPKVSVLAAASVGSEKEQSGREQGCLSAWLILLFKFIIEISY